MAGANPMWVSRQMGHRNMQMILNVYGFWNDGADKSKEAGKLEMMFAGLGHNLGTKHDNVA
jgi:integrase